MNGKRKVCEWEGFPGGSSTGLTGEMCFIFEIPERKPRRSCLKVLKDEGGVAGGAAARCCPLGLAKAPETPLLAEAAVSRISHP